jgi:hypothetical protein
MSEDTHDHPGSKVGNKSVHEFPDGSKWEGKIADEIWHRQSDNPNKMLCLQLHRFEDGKHGNGGVRIEIRCGYYIKATRLGSRNFGRWWWGESALMAPMEDVRTLFREAEKKGWFEKEKSVQGSIPGRSDIRTWVV